MKKYANKQQRKRQRRTEPGVVLRQVRARYIGPQGQPIERLACGHMINPPDAYIVNRRRCPQCEAALEVRRESHNEGEEPTENLTTEDTETTEGKN